MLIEEEQEEGKGPTQLAADIRPVPAAKKRKNKSAKVNGNSSTKLKIEERYPKDSSNTRSPGTQITAMSSGRTIPSCTFCASVLKLYPRQKKREGNRKGVGIARVMIAPDSRTLLTEKKSKRTNLVKSVERIS